ncbi:VOC family protein [Dyella soli]|uniref:VOC family protein n=1 Tax=Dyella soli TaxID=522319 RepID=A0A4R0YNZ3_9GAMM|nr:VOC family protein [Dyella soli]TCI10516.1 VOC family protein [Dyella soli]
MKSLPGKLVWVEHASADPAVAGKFYRALFGWSESPMDIGGQSYCVIMNAESGIGGYRTAQDGEPCNWGIYLSVADVDASHARALAAGCRECMPPTDFPPVGRGATFLDPVGSMVSIWRSANDDAPDGDAAPGQWCWHELHATDPAGALAFYEALFGLSHEVAPTGNGAYYVLKSGDTRRGGIMKTQQAGASSAWLPYVLVEDVDAVAAKAGSLGADICVPPSDIPGIGRYAVLRDPQGASLAVFLPQRA